MVKINKKKFIYIAAILSASVFLCTGCANEREEKQLKYREEGITLMENGKYEEALESFQEALDLSLGEIGEEELDICFYKAEAQYKLGDTESAMATYTAIIDYNDNAAAYFLRGNLYYSLGDEENAWKDYAAAVENEKDDYELYIGIYEAMAAHENETEGQEYLKRALELTGTKAYDKMQKGRINYLLGEYTTAISLLEEAVAGKENTAYFYLAEIYADQGDEESSNTNMNAYMKSGVADSYGLYNIACGQLEKGNYDLAIECLCSALQMDNVPNKQIIMKTLVIAYEQTLDFDSARDIMKEYVELYPDDDEAAREYTFLQTR